MQMYSKPDSLTPIMLPPQLKLRLTLVSPVISRSYLWSNQCKKEEMTSRWGTKDKRLGWCRRQQTGRQRIRREETGEERRNKLHVWDWELVMEGKIGRVKKNTCQQKLEQKQRMYSGGMKDSPTSIAGMCNGKANVGSDIWRWMRGWWDVLGSHSKVLVRSFC